MEVALSLFMQLKCSRAPFYKLEHPIVILYFILWTAYVGVYPTLNLILRNLVSVRYWDVI